MKANFLKLFSKIIHSYFSTACQSAQGNKIFCFLSY
jgi:hypothetical protein